MVMAGPAPGRPIMEPALRAVEHEIENGGMEDRFDLLHLPRRGCSSQGEDTGSR